MRINDGWRRGLRAALMAGAAAGSLGAAQAADLSKIKTIVVIYAENRSFDNLYGLFPGADGIANAKPKDYLQRDHDGSALPYLRVWNSKGEADPNYPQMPIAELTILYDFR